MEYSPLLLWVRTRGWDQVQRGTHVEDNSPLSNPHYGSHKPQHAGAHRGVPSKVSPWRGARQYPVSSVLCKVCTIGSRGEASRAVRKQRSSSQELEVLSGSCVLLYKTAIHALTVAQC